MNSCPVSLVCPGCKESIDVEFIFGLVASSKCLACDKNLTSIITEEALMAFNVWETKMFGKKDKVKSEEKPEPVEEEIKPFDHILRLCDNFAKSEQPFWQRKLCSEFVHQATKVKNDIAEQERKKLKVKK